MKLNTLKAISVSSVLAINLIFPSSSVMAVEHGETPITSPVTSPIINNNSNKVWGPTSPANPPVCNNEKPLKAPILVSANLTSRNEVTLNWIKAQGEFTHYQLIFGTSQGSQQFGSANIGNKHATSYKVTHLVANTTYHFKIKAVNGCMPGELSNELSIRVVGNNNTNVDFSNSNQTQSVLNNNTQNQSTQSAVIITPNENATVPQNSSFFADLFNKIKEFFSAPFNGTNS